eukprot:CAMPEP_0180535418 /NCGR_PEP_ID=MMETSP1036_2-20121128/64722_1 /TAXON_ID=632150 /ORGANISM="Azadinium spinosum, Strain 3D9" /LENGTH=42 /DNA_ID= /DNA_START= /DNA_END= /DNA_ORIENTATION=
MLVKLLQDQRELERRICGMPKYIISLRADLASNPAERNICLI